MVQLYLRDALVVRHLFGLLGPLYEETTDRSGEIGLHVIPLLSGRLKDDQGRDASKAVQVERLRSIAAVIADQTGEAAPRWPR